MLLLSKYKNNSLDTVARFLSHQALLNRSCLFGGNKTAGDISDKFI